jgi:hypothetical protein
MATETKHIMEKLDAIKSELDYIREHLTAVDAVLTDDDIQAVQEAEADLRAGRTKRL